MKTGKQGRAACNTLGGQLPLNELKGTSGRGVFLWGRLSLGNRDHVERTGQCASEPPVWSARKAEMSYSIREIISTAKQDKIQEGDTVPESMHHHTGKKATTAQTQQCQPQTKDQ